MNFSFLSRGGGHIFEYIHIYIPLCCCNLKHAYAIGHYCNKFSVKDRLKYREARREAAAALRSRKKVRNFLVMMDLEVIWVRRFRFQIWIRIQRCKITDKINWKVEFNQPKYFFLQDIVFFTTDINDER